MRANKNLSGEWLLSTFYMTGRGKAREREREGGTSSLGVGKFNHTCCGVCLARSSQRWKVHRAREREREASSCSSRRASIAIGWEPQSYLLLLSFLSLIIAPSGPPIIFTLWLGMQGFALDRLDGKKLRAQPHTSSRESFFQGKKS
jgi:hypothetical protein